MKRVTIVVIAIAALVLAGSADAGGWAGSRYDKSDCTYNAETNILYCLGQFSDEQYTTMQWNVLDASCASGVRNVERTGWLVTSYIGWDYYSGRAPVWVHDLGYGNEAQYEFTWHDFTDVDQGCVPSA